MKLSAPLIWLALCAMSWGDDGTTIARQEAGAPRRSDITPRCQKSIDLGTRWLVDAIHHHGVGVDQHPPADLSCTAITGLALLSQGNTPRGGKYAREVERLLDIVVQKVVEIPENYRPSQSFTLVKRKIGQNADLFLSALFLSQILGDSGTVEQDVRQALEKLVRLISETQGKDGTWGNESWAPVLGTVLGWESLRASVSCGLKVEASAELAGKALMKNLEAHTEHPQDWMHNFYKEAASIRVLHSLGYRNDPVFEDAVLRIVKLVQEDDRPFVQAGGEEFLAFSLVTESILQNPRESWKPWYPTVRDKLIRVQNKDGSWSGHHCITARTFCTAAALLTLQAPNRCLPLSDF